MCIRDSCSVDSQLYSDRFSFFYFLDWTSESRETKFLVRQLLNSPRPIEELPPPIGGRHRLLCFMTNIKATNIKNTAGKSARVWPNPNFLSNFSKTKFALELSINVMKHTLHKWGGNISSIHNVIGPPKNITARLGKKNGKSWANSQARGGGFHVPT